jgi:hypothetical protein
MLTRRRASFSLHAMPAHPMTRTAQARYASALFAYAAAKDRFSREPTRENRDDMFECARVLIVEIDLLRERCAA